MEERDDAGRNRVPSVDGPDEVEEEDSSPAKPKGETKEEGYGPAGAAEIDDAVRRDGRKISRDASGEDAKDGAPAKTTEGTDANAGASDESKPAPTRRATIFASEDASKRGDRSSTRRRATVLATREAGFAVSKHGVDANYNNTPKLTMVGWSLLRDRGNQGGAAHHGERAVQRPGTNAPARLTFGIAAFESEGTGLSKCVFLCLFAANVFSGGRMGRRRGKFRRRDEWGRGDRCRGRLGTWEKFWHGTFRGGH